LFSHNQISYFYVNDHEGNKGCFLFLIIPENLKNNLLHLILSHQGKLEYASPVVPKTLEAITLYQADELSAKVNAYKNVIANEIYHHQKSTVEMDKISTRYPSITISNLTRNI